MAAQKPIYRKVLRTYRFKDKDPVCGEMMTLVDEAGLRGKKNVGKVATLAALSHGCVDALLYGETRKPQNATIMAIATSLGYERRWQRTTNKWELEAELKKARAFIAAQARLRAKVLGKKKPKKKSKKGGKVVAFRKAA